MFIERVSSGSLRTCAAGRIDFTTREMEVLEMPCSRQIQQGIGAPLGIEERTVKAHVAKLMRKVGCSEPHHALSARHYSFAGPCQIAARRVCAGTARGNFRGELSKIAGRHWLQNDRRVAELARPDDRMIFGRKQRSHTFLTPISFEREQPGRLSRSIAR